MSTLSKCYYRSTFIIMSAVTGSGTALASGIGPLPATPGPGSGDPAALRALIVRLLQLVLSFLALAAVVFIIIAGIRLIVSQGEEEQKNKAKKTIIYVVIGLIVVLFAKVIVNFISTTFGSGGG
ncbi:hypothetical protein HY285_01655 [Candidatus Peregrinibacteria bacterium]|nr:hypothetical protein [Candidatus Peregrinibacteria bacterium]MBI3816233.1 hypothetical protein [Candidatus Peregrinibacteria bacterium]